MYLKKRKAFTMLELTFVIVIIGILSAVAIPRFAATKNDAIESRSASTLGAVRSALATERQKRILRGLFDPITSLHADNSVTSMFTFFSDTTDAARPIVQAERRVLEYPVTKGTSDGQWDVDGTGLIYTAYFMNGNCVFTLASNRLDLTGANTMTLATCEAIFNR